MGTCFQNKTTLKTALKKKEKRADNANKLFFLKKREKGTKLHRTWDSDLKALDTCFPSLPLSDIYTTPFFKKKKILLRFEIQGKN